MVILILLAFAVLFFMSTVTADNKPPCKPHAWKIQFSNDKPARGKLKCSKCGCEPSEGARDDE